MADRDDALIKLHEDVPLFREAIAFTAAKTDLPPDLPPPQLALVFNKRGARHVPCNIRNDAVPEPFEVPRRRPYWSGDA